MKLNVMRTHAADYEAMRARLVEAQERLRDRYRVQSNWVDAHTVALGAPGVRGRIEFDHHELRIALELSPVLRPLRSRIEKELGRELDRVVMV